MNDRADWQALNNSAIFRKHRGDLPGAIQDMMAAIRLARVKPSLLEETATMLNYLSALYIDQDELDQAEEAIRDAVALSVRLAPILRAANLMTLAGILWRKRQYVDALAPANEALHLYREQGHSDGVGQAKELIQLIK